MTDTMHNPGPSAVAGAGTGSNPRSVITGVTLGNRSLYESAAPVGVAEFDWYASTVYVAPDRLLEALADNLGGEVQEGKPLHGYKYGFEIKNDFGVIARVLSGGGNGHPHAWGSGADAAAFADVVRALWPDEHHVTRMDSRVDFGGNGNDEDVWDELFRVCTTLAEKKNLKTSVAGDYLGKENGRTLYIGSKSSSVFVRLYEKGKQLRRFTRDGDQREAIPTNWCRLELQGRPVKDGRIEAVGMSPEQAWGMSPWARELAQITAGLDVERVTMHHKRETDDERALAWMCEQYAATLDRLATERGWDALQADMRARVARNLKNS